MFVLNMKWYTDLWS